jgi:hypothetical protein
MLADIKAVLLEAPEHSHSDIDVSLKDDIRKWSDPPTSDEIKAVLDKAAYCALASGFGMKVLDMAWREAMAAEGKPVEPIPEPPPKHTALFTSTKPYSEPEGGWVAYLNSLSRQEGCSAISGQFMGRPDLADIMDKEFHANPEFQKCDVAVRVTVAMCGSHFKDAFKGTARAEFISTLAVDGDAHSSLDGDWIRRMA